ncbi:MAG: hypothetical protein U1D30_20035 [Planctomycetota bacterium]
MQTRQKILALGFGLIAVLFGGNWAWTTLVSGPLGDLDRLRQSAEKKAREANLKLVAARHAKLELEELSRWSLPKDPTLAQEEFQSYLIRLLQDAKIAHPTITPGPPNAKEGVYVIPFMVQGEATMASLTHFLHAFYRTPRLQQISQLSLNPIEREDMGLGIRFSLSMEALAFGDGNRTNGEAPTFAARVESGVDSYAATVERNVLFARGPGGGAFSGNMPEHVVLTSIVRQGNEGKADIYDRAVNSIRPVRVGDSVTVGAQSAVVVDLGLRDAVLDMDGRWWLWELGTSFSARTPLSPEQALDREILKSRQAKDAQ